MLVMLVAKILDFCVHSVCICTRIHTVKCHCQVLGLAITGVVLVWLAYGAIASYFWFVFTYVWIGRRAGTPVQNAIHSSGCTHVVALLSLCVTKQAQEKIAVSATAEG